MSKGISSSYIPLSLFSTLLPFSFSPTTLPHSHLSVWNQSLRPVYWIIIWHFVPIILLFPISQPSIFSCQEYYQKFYLYLVPSNLAILFHPHEFPKTQIWIGYFTHLNFSNTPWKHEKNFVIETSKAPLACL